MTGARLDVNKMPTTSCAPEGLSLSMWLGVSVPLCRCALGLECPLLLLKVNVAQSCPTLCDPMDCSVHGILQVRILEWVAVSFSKVSSQLRDRTQVSHIAGGFLGWGASSHMVQQRWKILCATTKTWQDLRKRREFKKTSTFDISVLPVLPEPPCLFSPPGSHRTSYPY